MSCCRIHMSVRGVTSSVRARIAMQAVREYRQLITNGIGKDHGRSAIAEGYIGDVYAMRTKRRVPPKSASGCRVGWMVQVRMEGVYNCPCHVRALRYRSNISYLEIADVRESIGINERKPNV